MTLTPDELTRLASAVEGDFPPEKAPEILNWAEEVAHQHGLLDGLLSGTLCIRREGDTWRISPREKALELSE